MVSQYGIKFAIHLITNHFGNLVAKVCEKLLGNGPLTLEQLIRYTELTKEQVKNSLLVLVQHNCAQAFVYEGGDGDGSRVRTQYLALFDNILHRLRFPKFLEIASRHLDDECVELLDGLLRDGRLTLKQMVDRASQGKENVVTTDVVRESLRKLLTARYVERCPVPEVVISTLVTEETTTKKRGAKSAKKFEAPETLEQRVIEATVPGEAIRFSLTTDAGCNADRETNSDDSQMMSVGENDAKEELTLWRANFEEFIRYLRHKVLIENVRTRMDDGAATVLSAILEATKTVEKKVKIENSGDLDSFPCEF
ncbi:Winged helix-like DNA-binding domain superfamily [Sesbania bispinosa]|nr:Winged helix-like DNA-binding domain superfamily [Sesbania bispinosa]